MTCGWTHSFKPEKRDSNADDLVYLSLQILDHSVAVICKVLMPENFPSHWVKKSHYKSHMI